MFNTHKLFALRSLTMKYVPFSDGPQDGTGKTKSSAKTKLTYKNIHGATMSLRKRKYTYTDLTKRDAEGKPVGPVLEATLTNEDLGVYGYEEYDRNEFERIAIADEWPVAKVLEMLQEAPATLEKEIKEQKANYAKFEKKQAGIDGKLTTVISNYSTLFSTYENVRLEISAMAVELPALKGTPYDRPYFLILTPVVENMAKINFPELVSDPAVQVPTLVPTAAAAPIAAPLTEGGIKPVESAKTKATS